MCIRLETYPKSKRFSVSDPPPFWGVWGGVWCVDIFVNFAQMNTIQKMKMFKSMFWLQKKILGPCRIFYERINFYENYEFVIFVEK